MVCGRWRLYDRTNDLSTEESKAYGQNYAYPSGILHMKRTGVVERMLRQERGKESSNKG